MNHLRTLRLANYAMAGLEVVGLTILVITAALIATLSPIPADEVVLFWGVMGGVSALLVVWVGLFLVAASSVGRGRGRALQTVLGVFSLGSFPFGFLYGVYALWVVWMNEETRAAFDGGGELA